MKCKALPAPSASAETFNAQLDHAWHLSKFFAENDRELYLVGGAVRDALLGQVSDELDFATSASPTYTAELLEAFGSRKPYRVGEKFGTIGGFVGEVPVEITTYRSREVYSSGSRKPEVEFGTSLEDDLARRDFTINAIALDLAADRLIDPFLGAADLRNRVVRAVGEPSRRFVEDPLRLLRAVRFAARFEFEIEAETWNAMQTCGHALSSISRERIRDEYSRYLQGVRPSVALALLRDSGLLAESVPRLVELTKMPDHGANHPLSLWDHTMRVVDEVAPRLPLRWAALVHDIAKPATRTHEPDGRTRFFHHESRGAELARQLLTSLRYPAHMIREVALLVETHMQIHAYSAEWSNGAVRRLHLRLGANMNDAILLAQADAAGHSARGAPGSEAKFDALKARLSTLDSAQMHDLQSPLRGNDLMNRYGRAPGPWIRAVKARLLDEVVDGTLRADDEAGAWLIADRMLKDDC